MTGENDTQPTEGEQPTEPQEQEKPEQTPEEQPEEVEAKDDAEGEEPAEEGGEEKPAPAQSEKPKHARAGGYKRTIDRQARELAELQRRNAELVEYALKASGQKPANEPAQAETPETKAQAYIQSLVAKELAAREAKAAEAKAQAEAQAAHAAHIRRLEAARAALPDFDDVLESAADAHVSPAVQEALLTSEQGPAIMYSLARDPAELARISALPPLAAAREIGRLEAKLASATASPAKPKPAIRPPAPPTNVSGGSSGTRSLDELPITEYKRAIRSGKR